jgi:hypothetical protein
MPGKMARSDLDQAFGLPEVLVAVSTSRLSCKRAGKTRTLMPVWDSAGEFSAKTRSGLRALAFRADPSLWLAQSDGCEPSSDSPKGCPV